MSVVPVAPLLDQTVHVLGDIHWGALIRNKLDAVVDDLSSRYELKTPEARVMVGDVTAVGQAAQWEGVASFFSQLPPARVMPAVAGLVNLGVWAIRGNHDYGQVVPDPLPSPSEIVYGYDTRGVVEWTLATGLAVDYTVDLGWVKLIFLGWSVTSARLTEAQATWLANALTAADSKECWIVNHAPLWATTDGIRPGKRAVYHSSLSGFHVNTLTGSQSVEIRALLAAHANARVWISGHTHTPIDAPGIVFPETLGGKTVVSVNASAIVQTYGATPRRHNPVRTCYLTRASEALEIRWRDHRIGSWIGRMPGQRVERIAL